MTSPAFKGIRVEDELRSEETSPVKREYVGGFVYPVDNSDSVLAQSGSAEIIMNIMKAVWPVARKQGCCTFAREIKLRLDSQNSFYCLLPFSPYPLHCDKRTAVGRARRTRLGV